VEFIATLVVRAQMQCIFSDHTKNEKKMNS